MKSTLIIAALLILVSCGKDSSSNPVFSIRSGFESSNPKLLDLDLRSVQIGVEVEARELIGEVCNSGPLRGTLPSTQGQLADEKVIVLGSESQGTIQFGRLKSDKTASQDGPCAVMSTETYNYEVKGNVLKLCNLKYNVCDEYSRK